MSGPYVQPTPKISGWMGDNELQWLFRKAQEMDSIVEVGSWQGRSTHALCSGCPGTVYAIDHFKGSPSEIDTVHVLAKTVNIRELFDRNVGHFENLRTLQMDSAAAAVEFANDSIDMVFIDGDHAYEPVKADLLAWLPKCRYLICGHDRTQDGVPQALQEILGKVRNETGSLWSYQICAH